ncbi:hypothetical protein BJA01nite_67940 [Bradyrhizobium japonicum]|nr:hypothetical protein BJA01nite_67940 [Bradyrhizobium japonicum]
MLATSETLRAGWDVERPQIKASNAKLLRGFRPACKHFAADTLSTSRASGEVGHMHAYVHMESLTHARIVSRA